MTQYINKDALVAEVKRRIADNKKDIERVTHKNLEDYFEGYEDALALFKQQFLDTLEVKDVDLEDDVDNILESYDWNYNKIDFCQFAKHFFELGLKARIDKELVEEVYSHIDSIKDTADRMTSGNFMHHRAAIKVFANTIAKVLELMGFKA